ncbi:sulfatase-like hydrolase/transferase [Carboxylicivirga sediminis]|uniref:Sulfatase-like hydrolase/transferase n=1 Tax=Carboxylicivirga sediminis TaxID=2006564 RepID=A0A941F7N6_9BACT|nr:sulfatase-like hydrolase/transferase [Carboxylicivirga sediminis]MBR8538014.1 sulfatase-like hydrolase/transferase [Carboxylicivirga sediminis]
MKKKTIILYFVFCSFLLQAQNKPNIVIIYADDMGWGDVGYHGVDDILTPNIDALAESGVYFTQGYVSSSICSPSRCGLLTGVYQQRFTNGQNSRDEDPNMELFKQQQMLPDILKPADYYTGVIGKWHLGADESLRPNARGWDEFYGFLNGSHSFYKAEKKFTRIREYWPIFRNNEMVDYEGYTTEVFTDEAIDFIRRNHPTKTETPFCLYLAYNAVHFPWEVPDNYIQRVSHIKSRQRRLFAGMVLAMDDGVGKVIDELDKQGLSDNTIVFFISDNGSPQGQMGNMSSTGPFRGWKGDCLEGGIRVPYIIKWPGQIEQGSRYDYPVINLDIMPTIASFLNLKKKSKYQFDGVDLLPYIKGEKSTEERPHETLYWRRGKDMAIRHGDWKLVVEDKNATADTMLFNLAIDKGERRNLYHDASKKVTELRQLFEEWEKGLAPQQ